MPEVSVSRRTFSGLSLGLLGAAVTGCAPKVEGTVKGFPSRPIEMIVPFDAGGPTDVIGRIVADGLTKQLGHDNELAEVPVVNRTGAGGIVGTVEVMNANPDGHTLITVTGTSYGVQPHFDSTPYGPHDLTPIAEVAALPNVLVVNASSSIRTFDDYIEDATSRAEGLNYATTGVGSLAHVNFAALSAEARMETSDIPFDGNAPAINALLGNNIDSAVIQTIDAVPNIRSGDFRPLLVIGSHVPTELGDVPLATNLGYTVDRDLYFGIAAPVGLDPALAKLLEHAVRDTLQTESTRARFAALKMQPAFKSSTQFQEDIDAMGETVLKANEANGGSLK